MVSQLQVLSSYSLLQSTNEINNLVKQARQLGYDALALTDVNVTYGLIEFYKIARKNQLHPILGMTIQVEGLILTDQSYPLLVLAKNIDGYHNLLKLSSLLMTSKQTVSILDKKNLLQNLIVIVPAVDSELATLLEQNEQPLSDYLQKLLQIKSTDLYLGIGLRAKAQD
ncbi:PHP domain-containing protein, partial [Lactobacillus sp. XV13L]|nr:PHP domain-containing protein [Lactobacillus sp. XV13L]